MSWQAPPPDPTNPDLLDNLRQYLISNGLVRDPRVAGDKPPLWIAARFGCPAPGQTEGLADSEVGPTLVAEIKPATDVPPAPYEGWLRRNHVEFVIRARTPPPAISFENSVRALINDRRGWTMVNVDIIESLIFRGLQPIGSNNLGFTYSTEYQFMLEGPFQPVGP